MQIYETLILFHLGFVYKVLLCKQTWILSMLAMEGLHIFRFLINFSVHQLIPYVSKFPMKIGSKINHLKFFLSVVLSLLCVISTDAEPPVEGGNIVDEAPLETQSSDSIISEKNEVELQEDGTVADALQRRPDLRFGNVTVDGEKSDVSLSSMSSATVEKVEVLKAVTPDVDANSLSGSVSVKSKPAFEQKKRTLQGRLVGIYDSEVGSLNREGTLTVGNAFGPERRWGALLTVRWEYEEEGSDNRRIDWMNLETPQGDLRVIDRIKFDQWRDREYETELTGVLDYRASDQLSFFIRGNYETEDFLAYNPRLDVRFSEGTFVEASDQSASVEGARVERNLMAFEGHQEKWSTAVGGFFVNNKVEADFRLSYEESDYIEPDFFKIEFAQTGIDLIYDLSDREFPRLTQVNGDTFYDPAEFEFDEMLSEVYSRNWNDMIGTFNLKVKHGFGKAETGFWKIGGKMMVRELNKGSDDLVHDGYNGDYRLSDVLSSYHDDSYYGGRYRLYPAVGWPDAPQFRDSNFNSFVLNERRTRESSDPGTYDAQERITAGYGMGSYETGPFRVLAGVRYEQTDIDYTGQEVVINEAGEYEATHIRKGSSSYGNPFPGVHGRYRFNDWVTLIGSWTETIKRPEYRDLVPYRFVDRGNREVEEGNPGLEPSLYSNFDLAMDIVTPGEGLLSVELFAKEVGDYFYLQESTIPDGPYAGYENRRLENGPDASISGVEFTWAQRLGIVHEILSPMAFNINYLWRQSSIRYPNRPNQKLPLASLPDEELTLTVSYEKARFFGQIEVTLVSDTLEEIADDPLEDKYFSGRTQIDIDTAFEIITGIKLIAELDNITNERAMHHYKSSVRYPHYLRTESWKGTVGVRWDL
jgi:TonB-dependent receptor